MDAVRRRGSAARVHYIKRFLSCVLAMVLCMCLIQPQRTQAVFAEVGLVASGAVMTAPALSVLCTLILTAAGVDFVQGAFEIGDKGMFGSGAYEVGAAMGAAARSAGGAVWEWLESKSAEITQGGGFSDRIKMAVPSDVLEFARTWVTKTYDFTSGSVKIDQSGIFTADSSYLFSMPAVQLKYDQWVPVATLGTLIYAPMEFKFVLSDSETWVYTFNDLGLWKTTLNGKETSGGWTGSFDFGVVGTFVWSYVAPSHYLKIAWYNAQTHEIYIPSVSYKPAVHLMKVNGFVKTVSVTMNRTKSLSEPITQEVTIAAPAVPYEKVGGISVPVVESLTMTDIKSEATDIPDVGTGEIVGDIALEDIAAAQEGLGALFISKFPFCIPWDFARAVQLLAAPPKTPHWEVDFLAPIADRVGGWRGSTKIVIDFSDYEILGSLCRWVTTIMFIGTLVSGTKRLIWTA